MIREEKLQAEIQMCGAWDGKDSGGNALQMTGGVGSVAWDPIPKPAAAEELVHTKVILLMDPVGSKVKVSLAIMDKETCQLAELHAHKCYRVEEGIGLDIRLTCDTEDFPDTETTWTFSRRLETIARDIAYGVSLVYMCLYPERRDGETVVVRFLDRHEKDEVVQSYVIDTKTASMQDGVPGVLEKLAGYNFFIKSLLPNFSRD